jgi:hypothetical protein
MSENLAEYRDVLSRRLASVREKGALHDKLRDSLRDALAGELKLSTSPPSVVDVLAAEYEGRYWRTALSLMQAEENLRRERPRVYAGYASAEAYRDQCREERDAALGVLAPLRAEYARRPWLRYFLVPGGHVHRGMSCSTCYPTTHYGWLPELSGCDEAAMVEVYGTAACTICFPDAPTLPGWLAAEKRNAAEAAAKAAKTCPGSGRPAVGGRRYQSCPECQTAQFVTANGYGKFRKHNRPEE